jgi:homogentisate phytyltransferase/homogentisate geranylgeranyltransferase
VLVLNILENFKVIWKFSRPHTLVGTSFSVFGIFLVAINTINDFFSIKILNLFLVLLVTILANLYITGLNQLTDIDIDKINKPFLPLVSGELTINKAKIIISFSLLISILLSFISDFYLFLTVFLSIVIGTFYSIKPFRFKKVPILASISILSVRGLIVNIGIFIAFRNLFSYPNELNNQIIFLTIFISILSICIALLKDIPDLIGDKTFEIRTFPIIFGRKTVFMIAIGCLLGIYTLSIIYCIIFLSELNFALLGLVHIIVLIYLSFRAVKTKYEDNISINSFYFLIWKVFYLEYIIIPLLFLNF